MNASIGQDLPDLGMPEIAREPAMAPAGTVPPTVLRIPVTIQVVIGTARVPLSQVAQFAPGATITLDEKLGSHATILVNGREVAKGELFVLEDDGGRLGITISEVAGTGTHSTA